MPSNGPPEPIIETPTHEPGREETGDRALRLLGRRDDDCKPVERYQIIAKQIYLRLAGPRDPAGQFIVVPLIVTENPAGAVQTLGDRSGWL